MNTATQIIEAFKELPAKEQVQVADFIESQSSDIFELTGTEIAELNRRMNTTQKTYTLEEVFSKYGL